MGAAQACEKTCEDAAQVYYTFHRFLMRDVSCEEAYEHTNEILNGAVCYLRAEITDNEGETLWTLCPETMYKKCGSPDKVFGESDSDETFVVGGQERSQTL